MEAGNDLITIMYMKSALSFHCQWSESTR